MDKLEYITKQLSRTHNKRYENYVVNRIWNKLNDDKVKFITQQYIFRNDGKYAFTDMYFPQLDVHIEVDEPFHKNKHNVELDKIREADIINITNHTIIRVKISEGYESVNNQIDLIVETLKQKIDEMGKVLIPWDIGREYNPQTYIDKGVIKLQDKVAFRTIADGCRCFGIHYKPRARISCPKHPYEPNTMIWFPHISFDVQGWTNRLTSDSMVIYERSDNSEKEQEHFKSIIKGKVWRRIVFGKLKDSFGNYLYRFKGVFELNERKSHELRCLVWERTSDEVKTYGLHEKLTDILIK